MKHKPAKHWQIKLLIMLLRMRFTTKDRWLLKPIDIVSKIMVFHGNVK